MLYYAKTLSKRQEMPTRQSKSSVSSRRSSRRPSSRRRCATPSCLCNRSLGANLQDTRDFRIVTCSYGCKRPQFYFHDSCAKLYVESLRTCGYCKAKLISLSNTRNASLRETLRRNRRKRFKHRRRLGKQVVALTS